MWWLLALLMGLAIAAPLSLGIGPGDYALDEAFAVILAALGGEGRGADAGGPDAVAAARGTGRSGRFPEVLGGYLCVRCIAKAI